MPRVIFKEETIIKGRTHSMLSESFVLNVPTEIGNVPVEIFLNSDGCRLQIIHPIEVSDSVKRFLETYGEEEQAAKEELYALLNPLNVAARQVQHCLKYYCKWEGIHDALYDGKCYWSDDGQDWGRFPQDMIATFGIESSFTLRADNIHRLQEYFDSGTKMFFALKHLHKAHNEGDPRFKWIDATVAVELAFKEFMIRLKPDMETFLLYVPSPPLDILYGKVLESLIGEPSPKLKQIRDGATLRNRLLHRPHFEPPTFEQANEYLTHMEQAVYHLLLHLYPDDEVLKFSSDVVDSRLTNFETIRFSSK